MENRYRKNNRAIQALVISNAAVDETYQVKTLPCGGESLLGQLRSRDVGGKGANVATILARCGMQTRLMSVIGSDERGEHIKRELALESIDLDLISSTQCSTDVSMITVDDSGENTIVTTVEAAHTIEHSYASQALEAVPENCLLILQGNLTEELTQLLVSKAKQLRLRIVFNPSPWCPWMKSVVPAVDTIFMNAAEAVAITGEHEDAAVMAVLNTGPGKVVLTRGCENALLGTKQVHVEGTDNIHIESVPSVRAVAVDTTGAGDVFMGVAIASAVRRNSQIDVTALGHAASAAAQSIGAHGTRSAFPPTATLVRILAG